MSGKVVHTNELTIFIGDDLFIKTSANQTLDIIQRRKKLLEGYVETEKEEIDRLQMRLGVARGLLQETGGGDFINIREDYVEDDDKQQPIKREKISDEDFAATMSRLEELERLEEKAESEQQNQALEQGQLHKYRNAKSEPSPSHTPDSTITTTLQQTQPTLPINEDKPQPNDSAPPLVGASPTSTTTPTLNQANELKEKNIDDDASPFSGQVVERSPISENISASGLEDKINKRQFVIPRPVARFGEIFENEVPGYSATFQSDIVQERPLSTDTTEPSQQPKKKISKFRAARMRQKTSSE